MKTIKVSTWGAALAISCAALCGGVEDASATNILTFGLPGRPNSYNWQGFLSETRSGTVPTYQLLNIFSYYTPVGLTGTQRDQFQFEVRGAVGIQNNQASPTPVSYSSTGVSLEYYYNIIEDHGVDKMSPNYRVWWTTPQVIVNVPTGEKRTSGFGSGTDQFTGSLQANNYIAFGRLGISINPVTATYGFRNYNSVVNMGQFNANIPANTFGQLVHGKNGLNLTLADTAIGYRVTRDLFLGGQFQYNLNAVADSTAYSSRDFRAGPALIYLGFAKSGFFIAGNLSSDISHSTSLKRANVTQIWVEQYF